MSHISDVGKASTAPVTPAQPPRPTEKTAEIGGMPVRLATSDDVRSGPSDAGMAAERFHANAVDIDQSWSLAPSAQKSAEKASAAFTKVLDHLADGHTGEDTLGHLDEMIHEAQHNSEVLLEEMATSAGMSAMLRTFRFEADEIEKAKETLSYLRADHLSDASNLLDALVSAKLADTNGSDLRDQIDQTKTALKETLGSIKQGITKARLKDLHEVSDGVIAMSPDGVRDANMVESHPEPSEPDGIDAISNPPTQSSARRPDW